jgi:hypothetical protein
VAAGGIGRQNHLGPLRRHREKICQSELSDYITE